MRTTYSPEITSIVASGAQNLQLEISGMSQRYGPTPSKIRANELVYVGDDPSTGILYVSTNGPDLAKENVTWHRGDEPQRGKVLASVARCAITIPENKFLEGIVVVGATDVSVTVADLTVRGIALDRRTSGLAAKTAHNATNLTDVKVDQLRSHVRGPGSYLVRNVALGRVAQIGEPGQYGDAKFVCHDKFVGSFNVEGGPCIKYEEIRPCDESPLCPGVLAEVDLLTAQITGVSC